MTRTLLTAFVFVLALTFVGCTSQPKPENTAAPAPVSSPVQTGMVASPTMHPWSLVELDGAPVTVPAERARPSLAFDPPTRRASGMAGVNRYSGSYMMGRETLTFGPLLSTKMAGPPESNALETRFLRALAQTTSWKIVHGELQLVAEGKTLARFTPLPRSDR